MNIIRLLREQAKDYNCSVCGTNHSRSEIRLLGKVDSMWIVRVTCAKCDTSFKLLVAIEDGQRAKRIRREPAARDRRPPLGADDVIDAHEILETYEGGISALFAVDRKGSGKTSS